MASNIFQENHGLYFLRSSSHCALFLFRSAPLFVKQVILVTSKKFAAVYLSVSGKDSPVSHFETALSET